MVNSAIRFHRNESYSDLAWNLKKKPLSEDKATEVNLLRQRNIFCWKKMLRRSCMAMGFPSFIYSSVSISFSVFDEIFLLQLISSGHVDHIKIETRSWDVGFPCVTTKVESRKRKTEREGDVRGKTERERKMWIVKETRRYGYRVAAACERCGWFELVLKSARRERREMRKRPREETEFVGVEKGVVLSVLRRIRPAGNAEQDRNCPLPLPTPFLFAAGLRGSTHPLLHLHIYNVYIV